LSSQQQNKLTEQQCYDYIAEHIFKLRPESYRDQHPIWPGAVGIEVEMLPVVANEEKGKRPDLIPLQGEDRTLASSLRNLAKKRGWTIEEEAGDSGDLLMRVKMDSGDFLTFEPGGQLEFSSIPYPCLGDAVKRLRAVQADLNQVYANCGLTLMQLGQNPFYSTEEVGLQMPKKRYRAMDEHFKSIGPWGAKMMRLTCTLQVCLDFGPHETIMAQRFLLSQLLAPFATAIFANSPFENNQLADHIGIRSKAWRYIDKSRTGIPKGVEKLYENFDKETCVSLYAQMLFDSSVVFMEAADFDRPNKLTTFGEWINNPIDGLSPTVKDLETQLSLMFPEVRPRNFLELRSLDCQSVPWQMVPAAFYCGILYDDENLLACLQELKPYVHRLDELLLKAVDGLHDEELQKVSKQLLKRAISGFKRLPSCFSAEGSLEVLEDFNRVFTSEGRTPADDLKDEFESQGAEYDIFSVYQRVEAKWLKQRS
jgi:glutamate--cysteine ligase